MRINFFNKKLIEQYLQIVSVILAVESFVLIFVDYLSCLAKILTPIISLVAYFAIYFCMYLYVCRMKEKTLKIGNTKILVKFGDIFKEEGNKVIACNEYFDSIVDEKLISSKTLHGRVMLEYINDITDFDKQLDSDNDCRDKIIKRDCKRVSGKTNKYELGTCFKYSDFIFVAFTKFDSQNRAYLNLPDYMYCLSNFWNELNRVYDAENIVIPLLGSGITRFPNSSTITKQEQLEMLINALRYSNLSFSHDSSITIVLPENLKNEISIFRI